MLRFMRGVIVRSEWRGEKNEMDMGMEIDLRWGCMEDGDVWEVWREIFLMVGKLIYGGREGMIEGMIE